MAQKLPVISFLHFFATGPSFEFDDIYQLAISVYKPDFEKPEVHHFSIQPSKKITSRQFHESGISSSELKNFQVFKLQKDQIESVLSESDIIFYFGGKKEKARLQFLFNETVSGKMANLKLTVQLLFPFVEKFSIKDVAAFIYKDFKGFKPSIESQLKVLSDFCVYAHDRYLTDESLRFMIQNLKVLSTTDLNFFFIGQILPQLHLIDSFQIHQPSLLLEAAAEPINLENFCRTILRPKTGGDVNLSTYPEENVVRAISADTIESYLNSPILGNKEKSFEKRPEQVGYAQRISEAINQQETLLIEAGTGTGKTLGYLFPAMEYLRLNPGKRIIISTAMKNLQHQIFWNEITRIKRFFPEAFSHTKISILKGKSNYLCIGNLKKWLKTQWSEGLFNFSKDEYVASLYLLNLASYRNLVDIESIPAEIHERFPELNEWIEHLRSDIVCFKGSCNHSPNCLYDLNLREADKSQLIIVNHAKFLNLPPTLLSNAAAIIIDEADLFAGYLKSSLSVEVSSWDVKKLLSSAYSKKGKSGWLRQLKNQKSSEILDQIDELLQGVEAGYGKVSLSMYKKSPKKNANIYLPELQDFSTDYEIKSELNPLIEPVNDLYDLISDAMAEEKLKIPEPVSGAFHIFFSKLESLHDGLNAFCSDYPTKTFCHYFSFKEDDWMLGKRAVYLHDKFKHSFHELVPSWIFTSATLTLDGKFDHFINELGFDIEEVHVKKVTSPFQYRDQAALVISNWIPQFSYSNSIDRDKWNKLVINTSGYLSSICNGRTLILCTSYEQMNFIFNDIASPLESIGITVLKQEGASIDIINEFFEKEHSVLIGVDRLWTGVDFPGTTLSQLIIVKLPFNSLDEPEMKHRQNVDKQFFWDYYNGLAKLKFRQGVGRLIRSRQDVGVVVVLDQRLNQGKNRSFIFNLPEMPVYNYKTIEECSDFLIRKIDLKSEFVQRKEEIEPVLSKFQSALLSLQRNVRNEEMNGF